MLMNRFVYLFTRVISVHPDANSSADANRCRTTAIDYLHSVQALKSRMLSIWEKGQWPNDTPKSPKKLDRAKYPSTDSVFPQSSIYPKFEEFPSSSSSSKNFTSERPDEKISYPTLPTPPIRLTIPFDLAETFQRVADSNTKRGIETCGVLLGYKQEQGILLTTIVVPKQTGSRDTCEALPGAEEQILTYALTNDLVCVGWIHTHPTQSCFLSSVDLHTTLAYQQMLPEAVAIVVAPTDSTLPIGIFRLSTVGLQVIKNCPRRGFHSHDVETPLTSIVTDANWDTTIRVNLVDLRR